MKNLLKILTILCAFGISLTSCTYETLPKPEGVSGDVSWQTDVLPIFTNNCSVTGCHVSGAINPDLSAANAYNSLVYSGYVDVDNPELSSIYVKVNTGSMKNYASDTQKAYILAWIEQGALDN